MSKKKQQQQKKNKQKKTKQKNKNKNKTKKKKKNMQKTHRPYSSLNLTDPNFAFGRIFILKFC